MSPYHRPATPQDCLYVASHLRPEDAAEVLANSGFVPSVWLPHMWEVRGTETILGPDRYTVIGLCGVVASHLPGWGNVWMLGTPDISKCATQFIRESKKWLAEKHKVYPHMGNIVDARNTLHVRWLSLLGFKFTRVFPHGPYGLPFIQFERHA